MHMITCKAFYAKNMKCFTSYHMPVGLPLSIQMGVSRCITRIPLDFGNLPQEIYLHRVALESEHKGLMQGRVEHRGHEGPKRWQGGQGEQRAGLRWQ
jgi:hypothetical protein